MTTHRLVISLLAGALVVLGSACGSSSTVGTSGGPAITQAGALTADLDCVSDGEAVAGMSSGSDANGASTANEAVHDYLATAPAATTLRTASFDPAQPPRAAGALQGVTSAGTVPPVGASPGSTAPVKPMQWFAHRDTDGRVTAVINTSNDGRGWMVGALEYCQPGTRPPDGATATTIQAEASTTSSSGVAPATMPASTTSSSTPSTTAMGGP